MYMQILLNTIINDMNSFLIIQSLIAIVDTFFEMK